MRSIVVEVAASYVVNLSKRIERIRTNYLACTIAKENMAHGRLALIWRLPLIMLKQRYHFAVE